MKLDCYKIEVKTTNSSRNSTRSTWMLGQEYLDCEDGVVYVTTNDPKSIYEMFEDIVCVRKIGIGYSIQGEEKEPCQNGA